MAVACRPPGVEGGVVDPGRVVHIGPGAVGRSRRDSTKTPTGARGRLAAGPTTRGRAGHEGQPPWRLLWALGGRSHHRPSRRLCTATLMMRSTRPTAILPLPFEQDADAVADALINHAFVLPAMFARKG